MKLHSFRVFLEIEARSEDIPCWIKPHGTLHVLETSMPSAVQQNSNHYQDVIQISHSEQPVAEFLQKITFVILSIFLHLFYCQKTLYPTFLRHIYYYATTISKPCINVCSVTLTTGDCTNVTLALLTTGNENSTMVTCLHWHDICIIFHGNPPYTKRTDKIIFPFQY
jgi:hypothetical protein